MRVENQSVKLARPAVRRRGLSLVEILFVVAILALIASAAVPMFQSNLVDELQNAAQIVSADLQRARQLAVSNNSKYQLIFAQSSASYYLEHSGTNPNLDPLPSWPYKLSTDPNDRQTTALDRLPGLGDVQVVAVVEVVGNSRTPVAKIEFDSLGATSNANTLEVWLSAGSGAARRYLTIAVNPITGLTSPGDISAQAPAFDQTAGNQQASAPGAGSGSGSDSLLEVDLSAGLGGGLGVDLGIDVGGSGGLLGTISAGATKLASTSDWDRKA